MERKIGEIFEYNGEWYQCVVSIDGCRECSFRAQYYCTRHSECFSDARSDGISVIFKKLEKVGKPYEHYEKFYQCYKLPMETEIRLLPNNCYPIGKDNLVEIEIKQTKEDMEEKKVKLDKLVTDYTSNKITYNEFEKAVKELYADKEESKPILKSFSLEAAKAGKPVCTRDGRKARIICFDSNGGRPIVALVRECDDEEEIPYKYHYDGSYNCQSIPSDNDLMMLPEKKEGWVKIRKDINLYDTKEEADRKMIGNDEYVTAKVCWEE